MRKWVLKVETMKMMKVKTTDHLLLSSDEELKMCFFFFQLMILVGYMFVLSCTIFVALPVFI